MAQLYTLYPDVLRLVIEYLDKRDVTSLSRVSSRIRDVCVISLFRTLVWTWSSYPSREAEHQRRGIPEKLWSHVRNLTYILEDSFQPQSPSVSGSWSLSPELKARLALLPFAPGVSWSAWSSDGFEDTPAEDSTSARSPSRGLLERDETSPLHFVPVGHMLGALDSPSADTSPPINLPVQGSLVSIVVDEEHVPTPEFAVEGISTSPVGEEYAPVSEPTVEGVQSFPVVEEKRAPTPEPSPATSPVGEEHAPASEPTVQGVQSSPVVEEKRAPTPEPPPEGIPTPRVGEEHAPASEPSVEGIESSPVVEEKRAPTSEPPPEGITTSRVGEEHAPTSEPSVEGMQSFLFVEEERASTPEPPSEHNYISPVVDEGRPPTDPISLEPSRSPSPDFPDHIKPPVTPSTAASISDLVAPIVNVAGKAPGREPSFEHAASSSKPPIPASSQSFGVGVFPLADHPVLAASAVPPSQPTIEHISDLPVPQVTHSTAIVSAPLWSSRASSAEADELEDTAKADEIHPSVSEALSKVLPDLYVLRSFHFSSTIRGPWPVLLVALFKAANLEEIIIGGTPWRTSDQRFDEAATKTLSRKSIKRFSYLVPFFYDTTVPEHYRPLNHYMGRRDEPARHTEAHNLSILLPLFSQTLKYLELPSELIDVITGVSFPKLKELKVVGPSPMFEWLENVLTQTPNLRALTILFSRQLLRPLTSGIVEEHPGFHDFTLIPPLEVDDTSISDTVVEWLSKLSSFTLSSPHPADRVFQCLPAGLSKLAFPSYPPGYREYTKHINGIHTVAISSTRLLEVFQTISHIEDLTHLEVAYSIDTHESHEKLMRFICSTFKKLTSLEVHSYKSDEYILRMDRDSRPELEHGTIDLLEEHLPRLLHLSSLKLNADYKDELRMTFDYEVQRPDPALEKEFASKIHSFLRRLADAVPSLCSISMLMTHVGYRYGRNDWNNWDILRSPITGEIDICPPDGQRVLIPIDF